MGSICPGNRRNVNAPRMVANAVDVLEQIIREQSSKQKLNLRKAGGINERRMSDL